MINPFWLAVWLILEALLVVLAVWAYLHADMWDSGWIAGMAFSNAVHLVLACYRENARV